MEYYKALERYTREHGNPHVPRMYSDIKLAKWVWIQRHRKAGDYKPGGRVDLITAEQEALLDKLGFRWTFSDYRWDEFFSDLKAFKEKHGHCSVSSEKDCIKLTKWVYKQRRQHSRGELDPERSCKISGKARSLQYSYSLSREFETWNVRK